MNQIRKNPEVPSAVASLVALIGSVVCIFCPFINIPDYKPVLGIQLIFQLFRRFDIAMADSNAIPGLTFYSTSVALVFVLLFFVLSAVFLFLFLRGGRKKWLDTSFGLTLAGLVAYGIQLFSSSSWVSDFFGVLSQATKTTTGAISYQVPLVNNVYTGFGARLLAVFALVAMAAVGISKYKRYENADRTAHLQTPLGIAYRQFKRNKLAIFGLAVVVFVLVVCFFGPVFTNYAMLQTDIDIAKQAPSLAFPFGTDSVGRDGLTRLLYGGRDSLEIGFVVVFIELIIGTIVGGIAGFYGGWVDNLLMRIDDVFLSLPMMPVVIIIGAVMMDMKVDPSQRIYYIMLVLGLLFWPTLARLVRGQILSLREQEYMVAAEALGIRDRRRIFRHLVPNALPNIIVTATLDIGNAILTESALSFLGLGVAIPYPSWGNIVNAATNNPIDFALRPWLWIPAGTAILITVLCFNLVGDGLRDAFDPKMKQ